jgi:hypothetical protein
MRSGIDQRPRGRFNANRPSHQQARGPQRNQTLNTHGPSGRIQGSAFQIYQRYLTLAQEAERTDDRIAAENYYQHAEHYFRVTNEMQSGNSAGRSPRIDQDTVHPGFVAEPGETLIEKVQPSTDDDQPWRTIDPDLHSSTDQPEPQNADEDEIRGDDVVEDARNKQNEYPGQKRGQGLKLMRDG